MILAEFGCIHKYLRRRSGTTPAEAFLWGRAGTIGWSLVGQHSTRILAVAEIRNHFGVCWVYPQIPPQTRWHYAGRKISFRDSAETINWSLVRQISTRILVVSYVRNHLGGIWVYPQLPAQMVWHYAGRQVSVSVGQCADY